MAKLSPKEFMEKAKQIIGERDDDEALSFLEDCKDTISDDESGDDWKSKYDTVVKEKEQLDKDWRKRYRDTFFSSDSHNDNDNNNNKGKNDEAEDEEIDKEEQANSVRFDDLFETKD